MANRWVKSGSSDIFYFLGLQNHCGQWLPPQISKMLAPWKRAMTNPDIIDITLLTKIHIVKAMVSPVVVYGCETWTIKKAEHQRTDAFSCSAGKDSWETLGLQRDQISQAQRKSTLYSHWKDQSWSWSFNTLATWCKEPTHWKRPWCWERLRTGEVGNTGWEVGWHHRLKGHEFAQTPRDSEGQGSLAGCSPWSRRVRHKLLTDHHQQQITWKSLL